MGALDLLRARGEAPDGEGAGTSNTESLRGVIDIGSNSVRLVVFALRGHSVTPHYNEKVMAGLGRGLGQTGRLDPDGIELALAALKRFRAIADGLGDVPVEAFATAAVRTAGDGADFVERARRGAGFDICVLSGPEEAVSSAEGVRAGLIGVDGVVGDLGGSSLELIACRDGHLGNGETHLVGPLALQGEDGNFDEQAVRARVQASLAESAVIPGAGATFYAVGGSFRAFARVHMDHVGYPLRLLHGYTMTEKDVRRLAKRFADPGDDIHDTARGVSQKRAPLLPYAALVLDEIFRVSAMERLQVSAYGLREGRLFMASDGRHLPERVFLDGVETVGRLRPEQRAFCDALTAFVAPVIESLPPMFEDAARDTLLLRAACRLSDIGATLHPEYRAQLAYDLVRHGPFAGVGHAERLFLAGAAARRYSKGFRLPEEDAELIGEALERCARQVGALMRLGAALSGRTAELLAGASLRVEAGALVLRPGRHGEEMVSEIVTRRLEQAARELDLDASIG